jgi:uncharacterized protein (DUF427 family)
MAKATYNGVVLAESHECIELEGNKYFPWSSVNWKYFRPSELRTVCPWKGTARYYDIEINGDRKLNVAWCYPDPKPAAAEIRLRVGFWRGVKVE